MKLYRIAAILSVVLTTLWLSVPSAQAMCMSDSDCWPHLCGDNNRCTTCLAPGATDDVLYQTSCCSGEAVPGSTYCSNPADWGTTWASCTQICA